MKLSHGVEKPHPEETEFKTKEQRSVCQTMGRKDSKRSEEQSLRELGCVGSMAGGREDENGQRSLGLVYEVTG